MYNADELRETYNLIASDYTHDHLADSWDDDYCEAFINALPENSKVLDIGSALAQTAKFSLIEACR